MQKRRTALIFFCGETMKLKDLREQCALSETELMFYKDKGLFDETLCSDSELTDDSIEILSAVSLFREAGLGKEQIAEFCMCNDVKRKIQILRKARDKLLNEMHCAGQLLDKVDFILYNLQHKNK